MNKIILATNNYRKISEIQAILAGLDVGILSAIDFPDFPLIEETGLTLLENASLKAEAVWNRYHIPAIADDTGLEVDYLNGAPGIFSSRFAGEGCSYDDNNWKLLGLLAGVPAERRTARFRTVIAFMNSNGALHHSAGILEGSIALAPAGHFGFGYDPVFIISGDGRTLAQLDAAEKNKISHRGRALEGIRPILIDSFS